MLTKGSPVSCVCVSVVCEREPSVFISLNQMFETKSFEGPLDGTRLESLSNLVDVTLNIFTTNAIRNNSAHVSAVSNGIKKGELLG